MYYACIWVTLGGVQTGKEPDQAGSGGIRPDQAVLSGSHRYSATSMQMWAPLGGVFAALEPRWAGPAGARQEDGRKMAGGRQEDGRKMAGGRQEGGRQEGGRQEAGRNYPSVARNRLAQNKSCSLPARPQRGHRC